MKIHFYIRFFTRPGQSLAVTGNIEALGNNSVENAFYTDPVQQILLKEHETAVKAKALKHYTHIFKVKAPLLKKNEVICIVGNTRSLAEWDTDAPVLLHPENNWWTVKVNLPKEA